MINAVYAIPAIEGEVFARNLAKELGAQYRDHYRATFDSGEIVVRVDEVQRGTSVIVYSPNGNRSESLIELLLLADALRRQGALEVVCVFKYLPFSRSNRMNIDGVALGARAVISAIETSAIDRYFVFDLHAREILGFFSKPVQALPTLKILSDAIPVGPDEIVVSPDRGRYDDCHQIAQFRNSNIDLLVKVRKDDSGASELAAGTRTPLRGRSIVLFDDEIWSGQTALHAVDWLFEAGVARVDYVTVYDFTSPEVRAELLEHGVSTFVTTNLALPGDDPFNGRYVVKDVSLMVSGRLRDLVQ